MSVCKQCGLDVRWTREGARMKCLNADGSDHWDLCSKTRTARALRDGMPFENREGGGVHHERKDKYMHRAALPIKGAAYTPSCGQCTVPPWEECACSALLKVAA